MSAYITYRVAVDADLRCSFQEAANMAALIVALDDEKENRVEYVFEKVEGTRQHGQFHLTCEQRKNTAGDKLKFVLGMELHDIQQNQRQWYEVTRKAIADHMLP